MKTFIFLVLLLSLTAGVFLIMRSDKAPAPVADSPTTFAPTLKRNLPPTAPSTPPPSATSPTATPPTAPTAASPSWDDWFEASSAMLEDMDFIKSQWNDSREEVLDRFIVPEKRAAFEEIEADFRSRMQEEVGFTLDFFAPCFYDSLGYSFETESEDTDRLIDEITNEYEEDLSQILGDEGTEEYESWCNQFAQNIKKDYFPEGPAP